MGILMMELGGTGTVTEGINLKITDIVMQIKTIMDTSMGMVIMKVFTLKYKTWI